MRQQPQEKTEHHGKLLDLRVYGGIASKIATAILQFTAIPLIVSKAGLEIYGLFGIFSIVIIYFSMADLGITKSTLRFVSMSATEKIPEVFSAIFLLATVFSLFIVAIGLFVSDSILALMNIAATVENRKIYYLALIISFLLVARSLYISVIYALEKYRVVYNTTVVFELLRWSASIAAVTLYTEVLMALIVVMTISTLLHVMTLAFIVHITNRVQFKIPRNLSVARAILRYSFSVFMIDTLSKISSYADKILVASTGVILNFTHYFIAFQVLGKISDFLSAASIPYIQSTAKHFGQKNAQTTIVTINAAFDTIGMLFLPPILSLLVFGKSYLALWLDPVIADDVYPFLAVLSAGYAMSIYGTISINLANAIGHTSISLVSSALMAATILVAGFFALPNFGPLGMSIVWTVTQAIPLAIVFPTTMRAFGISGAQLFLNSFVKIAGITVIFFITKILAYAVFENPTHSEILVFALVALVPCYLPTLHTLLRKPR